MNRFKKNDYTNNTTTFTFEGKQFRMAQSDPMFDLVNDLHDEWARAGAELQGEWERLVDDSKSIVEHLKEGYTPRGGGLYGNGVKHLSEAEGSLKVAANVLMKIVNDLIEKGDIIVLDED